MEDILAYKLFERKGNLLEIDFYGNRFTEFKCDWLAGGPRSDASFYFKT